MGGSVVLERGALLQHHYEVLANLTTVHSFLFFEVKNYYLIASCVEGEIVVWNAFCIGQNFYQCLFVASVQAVIVNANEWLVVIRILGPYYVLILNLLHLLTLIHFDY